MSGIINKIKEAVHGDSHSAPEGSHGPHNTRAANAADPRVDSDRDGSHQAGTGAGRTAGHGEYGSTNPFSSNTHSTNPLSSNTHGTAEGAHGPHSSRMANAADPRVDSDRDGSRKVGGGTGMGSGLGSGGMGTGMGHSGFGSSNTHSTNPLSSGTHNTNPLSSGTHNTHSTNPLSSGIHNTHGTAEGAHGPHSSRMANAADPRIDSDRDGSHNIGGIGMGSGMGSGAHTGSSGLHSHSGPGPAPNTAGPHQSDMLNKVDPRVDSNLDGSKTVGGNKTYQQ